MSRRSLGTLSMVCFILLAFPRLGHASIWDIIWSMSGPQMSSVFIFHCEVDWEHNAGIPEPQADFTARTASDPRVPAGAEPVPWTLTECRIYDKRIKGYLRNRKERTGWLSIDTIGFASTTNDADLFDVDAWKHTMVVFEPMFELRSFTNRDAMGRLGNLSFSHGVIGASYQILAGDGYQSFDKFAFKFRPIGMTYRRFNASFNLRWYPNGFTADEFGAVETRLDFDRPSEMVWGFSLGWIWDGPVFKKPQK